MTARGEARRRKDAHVDVCFLATVAPRAGVKRALVSSTPDDGTIKLYQRDPKRIVPILRPYRTRPPPRG